MTAELRRNLVLTFVGLAGGFGLIVALFGSAELLKRPFVPTGQSAPPAETGPNPTAAKTDGPAALPALSGAGEGTRAAGGARPGTADAGGSPEPGAGPGPSSGAAATAPSFDLVRVEPTGETVVAGRGLPNTAVEMLVNGRPVARALADPNGQFALVPPALAPGDSEIVLRVVDAQGRETRSSQSVAVAVSPDRRTRPLVALSSPDGPTVVLSQPEAAAPRAETPAAKPAPGASPAKTAQAPSRAGAADKSGRLAGGTVPPGKSPAQKPLPGASSALKIVSVDAQEGGRLYVTGQGAPGATVRLYLNDTLVAPASVGPDGTVVFTIGRGVASGDYRVRIDQVDSVTGAVRTRAEVPFAFPEAAARVASREPAAGDAARAGKAAAVPPPGMKPEAGRQPAGPLYPGTPGGAKASMAAGAGPRPDVAAGPDALGAGLAAGAEHRRPSLTAEAVPAGPTAAQGPAPQSRPAAGTGTAVASAAGAAETESNTAANTPAAGVGSAFVPEIATARITRGDSLWQISRRIYGSGLRYTVIYDANQEQIRDPDRIFPGQIFVLPEDALARHGKGGRG